MKQIAMITALLAVVLSAVSQDEVTLTVPVGASGVPAASSVAAPTTLK